MDFFVRFCSHCYLGGLTFTGANLCGVAIFTHSNV